MIFSKSCSSQAEKSNGCNRVQNNLIALAIGLVTSVVGAYSYTYLIKIEFPFVYAIGAVALVAALGLAAYLVRGKSFLLFQSGVNGYYPLGQSQYIQGVVSEVRQSKELLLVGARGMDLVGDNSPIGVAIADSKKLNKIEVLLLDPAGDFSRLRSDHLEVERRKYKAECESVDNFLGVLKLQADRPVVKYSYNQKPLFRIIVTDQSIWLATYQPGVRGRDLPCWHISRTHGPLAFHILSYCEYLKGNSKMTSYTQTERAAGPSG